MKVFLAIIDRFNYLISMKVNETKTEILNQFAQHNAKMNAIIKAEEDNKVAIRRAHISKPYTRSKNAAPFKWD